MHQDQVPKRQTQPHALAIKRAPLRATSQLPRTESREETFPDKLGFSVDLVESEHSRDYY